MNKLFGNDKVDYLSSIKTDNRNRDNNNLVKLENHIRMLNQPIINNKTGRLFEKHESTNYPKSPKNSGKENEIEIKTLKNLKSEIIERVNVKFVKKEL